MRQQRYDDRAVSQVARIMWGIALDYSVWSEPEREPPGDDWSRTVVHNEMWDDVEDSDKDPYLVAAEHLLSLLDAGIVDGVGLVFYETKENARGMLELARDAINEALVSIDAIEADTSDA